MKYGDAFQFLEKHRSIKPSNYNLNDKFTETDQFVGRLHMRRMYD